MSKDHAGTRKYPPVVTQRAKTLSDCKVRSGMKCELGTPVTGPFLGIQWDYVCMGALAADETRLG